MFRSTGSTWDSTGIAWTHELFLRLYHGEIKITFPVIQKQTLFIYLAFKAQQVLNIVSTFFWPKRLKNNSNTVIQLKNDMLAVSESGNLAISERPVNSNLIYKHNMSKVGASVCDLKLMQWDNVRKSKVKSTSTVPRENIIFKIGRQTQSCWNTVTWSEAGHSNKIFPKCKWTKTVLSGGMIQNYSQLLREHLQKAHRYC